MKLPYFLVIVTALCVLFQLPDIQSTVIWNIDDIHQGHWWRILTGNFTHTNLIHLAMNVGALWIMAFLFRPTSCSLAGVLLTSGFTVGAFLLFSSNLYSYAGLSGILHGIFAYYSLNEALSGRRSSWLLVIGVIAKIGYEQFYGASAETARLIGAQVATEAHLFGGISGLLLAVVIHLRQKRTQSTTSN